MGSPSRTSQPNLQSARTGSGATSVNRCFTPPLLGLAPHRRRLRVLELSRATLFEPKCANVAAPGLGANHQPAILQHGIVASPNVFPALTGVGFGVLLDLWEDWTAMPLVVIDGQSVLEIDAVADNGEIVLWAISEHVEDAGVHSGDATLVLPPQSLYLATIRQARKIAQALAKALGTTGPFNVQYLAKLNEVKVIECNLRASRSFPFVSKVTGNNFVIEAMRRMLGVARAVENHSIDLDYVAVKAPMFSFSRLVGADPMLGVEMASTGEVGCFGDDLHEALLHALLATGFKVPRKGVLLSLGPLTDKYWFADEARVLAQEMGLKLYATHGTAEALTTLGIECTELAKRPENGAMTGMDAIEQGLVDLVINIPIEYDELGRPDGYHIRRRAVDAGIPLITDLQRAQAIVEALRHRKVKDLATSPGTSMPRGARWR